MFVVSDIRRFDSLVIVSSLPDSIVATKEEGQEHGSKRECRCKEDGNTARFAAGVDHSVLRSELT